MFGAKVVRDGCQALAFLLISTLVIFFPILRSHSLFVPAKWSLKDAQQMLNFIVIGLAVWVSLLLKHCLGWRISFGNWRSKRCV